MTLNHHLTQDQRDMLSFHALAHHLVDLFMGGAARTEPGADYMLEVLYDLEQRIIHSEVNYV